MVLLASLNRRSARPFASPRGWGWLRVTGSKEPRNVTYPRNLPIRNRNVTRTVTRNHVEERRDPEAFRSAWQGQRQGPRPPSTIRNANGLRWRGAARFMDAAEPHRKVGSAPGFRLARV